MAGDGLVVLGARPIGLAAVLEALPEEARGEPVEVQGLGAERVEACAAMIGSEADHALHGGEGLFGEVARGVAPLGPGQGIGSDTARLVEQDVAVIGAAHIIDRPVVLRHMLGGGGVLVAPGLAAVDGDALAAAFEEHLDHAFADADVDLAAHVALRCGVVILVEADVTVRPDLALDPLSPLPGVSRQRGQGRPLVRLEERAAALTALGHGGIVEAVELAADGSVHGVEGEEGLVAQCQQDDWERHVRAQPGTSTVVLARTKAEGRALSWLMRERVLSQTPEAKRAVIEVSRDLDGRLTEPLEVAVGDRIRIGATQWEKQLFNGTVGTVEDLEVKRAEAGAVTRKARNRTAAGKDLEADADRHRPEFSVHITARTDDGRRVTFRHDEIRDWHDNIRLDYGYAMTIASAQGLTVDRAFLLVDDRPARETIYPAATRHREALDIYVNRAPLAFDIAEHRPEDEAERPVLDSDVRAYLAERWSRSQPKEAALDYVSDGMWRDAREDAQHHRRGAGAARQATAEAHAAANDNALVRIAQDIRHAVNGWRHGAAVDAFAAERSEVLAAWDELRERARDQSDAVALSPAFRATLDRHGALMKQAASFTARPQVFERLLSERAGIAQAELQELRDVHARAGSYLRSAAARAAHAARQDAEAESERERRDEERAPEPARRDASAAAETAQPDRPAARTSQDTGREAAPVRPAAGEPARSEARGPDLSQDAYRRLRRDWRVHRRRAELQGVHAFDLDGAPGLVERIAAFAGSEGLTAETRAALRQIVRNYRAHADARDRLRDYRRDVERHWKTYDTIMRRARLRDVPPEELPSWPAWLERNEALLRAGRAILGDPATQGPHLDRTEDARERLEDTLSTMERFSEAHRSQSRSRDRGPSRGL